MEKSSLNPLEQERKIEILKEEISVSKRLETERVYFRKEVETEDVRIPVELYHENIHVEHIPVNKVVEEVPKVQYSDHLTIIPVVREEAVIVKRLVLVEEIHIHKQKNTETKVLHDSVRKEVFKENTNNQKY